MERLLYSQCSHTRYMCAVLNKLSSNQPNIFELSEMNIKQFKFTQGCFLDSTVDPKIESPDVNVQSGSQLKTMCTHIPFPNVPAFLTLFFSACGLCLDCIIAYTTRKPFGKTVGTALMCRPVGIQRTSKEIRLK